MGLKWIKHQFNKRLTMGNEDGNIVNTNQNNNHNNNNHNNHKETQYQEFLFSLIDRKVFDVEDASITDQEYKRLKKESKELYLQSNTHTRSGRVIQEQPLIIIELVEGEPIYIEVNDIKVKYRVNIYHETKEVGITVLDPIKTKELDYKLENKRVLTL